MVCLGKSTQAAVFAEIVGKWRKTAVSYIRESSIK